MSAPLVTSVQAARRFLRDAHHLDAPLPDIATALAYHGYIQIDPINVCGRMHDLILRNRVAAYREGDLMRYLHGDDRASLPLERRTAFEHHLPNTGVLVAFPFNAWPHLLRAMRQWSIGRGAWAGRLTPREKTLATQLLLEIAARGPLGSEDFEDDRTARRVWGASRLVKATLQKLFFHGRILIAQRENNRRRYDLPERVLPASVLAQPEARAADTARWLALLKLRQRRLATFTREELRAVEDEVCAVKLADLPDGVACPPLFCLREDAPRLAAAGSTAETPPAFALLAPLDPIIYDRRITSALWGFDYTWEAYTPAQKRVRGYYALPVLVGTELVGHVDPKADRAARKLVVRARRIRRGHATAAVLKEFAAWLGLRR
ncbi:MAG TPA: crosslink repair DNA glycosylase YcaQ family protein [Opitutaceae bacterium]|nr:crosslink repair DNA glycosylase YcaQ family protein [Opitutaceae bacterium]